jgi:general secretion pathway protein D
MAEVLKISYVIDPKVKGIVNIHTSGQISTENLFNIFQTILNLNGATAVKKEEFYEIVPMSDAKKLAISPIAAKDQGKLPPQERYTIQIISLKYIPAAEVSKMIKPFLSDGADIVEHPSHNILMIGDMAANVKKAVDMINLFDLDIFSDLRVRIYPILNADVTEVAEEMERIFSSLEVSTKSGRGIGITFKPIKRINSLLAVSSIPNIFEKVEGWLKELDRTPGEETKLSVFVYYVQNAKAKDLADVLKEVFAKSAPSKEKDKKPPTPEPTPRGVRPTPAAPAPSPAKEEAATVPEGEINIVVDETSNALIIKAFQRDYRNVVETIKKLDLYPKQVLIEVYLAEITLDDTYKFGLEWARFMSSNPPNAQEVVVSQRPPADPFSQGLSSGSFIRYSIVELGGRISAAVNAAAADNRLNVISSPHILASNNKEAKIQIGKSQPILTSTYTTAATGVATSVVEGTIEYKDIGIILTVTPRLSDSGLVTMEIQIEKSDVNITALGNLTSVPVFDKKTAKTVLSVLEGQTIVIGGLIEDTKQRNKSGVPFLSKIPILGALFGFHDLQDKKTELILMMTPHIITDQTQSKSVTEEFRDKVEGIKKELYKEKTRKK